MPFQSHPPWLDHSNYTWGKMQVMKLLRMQFSSTFLLLAQTFSSAPRSQNTFSLCSFICPPPAWIQA
jgi:hypothetical protein